MKTSPRRPTRARRSGGRLGVREPALPHAHAFAIHLAPLWRFEWVVYSKRPFGGAKAVLAYLSRYTQRVPIAYSRLTARDRDGVTF